MTNPMIVKLTTREGVSMYQADQLIFFKVCESRAVPFLAMSLGERRQDAYLNTGTSAEVIVDGKTIQTFYGPIDPAEAPGPKPTATPAAEEFPISIEVWVEAKQLLETKSGAWLLKEELEKHSDCRNIQMFPDSRSINAKWVVTWERKT